MREFIVSNSPFVKTKQNTSKLSFHLFFVLLFFALFAVIKNGVIPYFQESSQISIIFFPILFILTGIITSLLVDLLVQVLFKINVKSNYLDSVNTGLILTLILPMYTPLWLVAAGVSIAIISKYIMLKLNKKVILMPVLIGWGIIMGSYMLKVIPPIDYLNPLEINLGTPLSRTGKLDSIGDYNYLVKPYGNLFDFLFGFVPGGLGTTSMLLCILAYLYLTANGFIKWKIPLGVVLTVFFTTLLIGGINGLGIWYALFQVCSGMLAFGSIFIAATNETSPVTPIGQILYSIFLGLLIVVLRFFTPLVDGALVAMLFMPITRDYFDYNGAISNLNFNKSIFLFVIGWLLIIFLGVFLGIHYLHI